MTRAYDPTRLYIEASGWYHVPGITDIIDVHDYDADPAVLVEKYEPLTRGEEVPIRLPRKWPLEESGKPTFVSEYGGIYWNPANEDEMDKTHGTGNWGYGDAPRSKDEFVARFKGQTEAFLFHPRMGGLCYTQLTDVEQEQNGLYTYDRKAKFDPAIFHAILTQKAAIEEEE